MAEGSDGGRERWRKGAMAEGSDGGRERWRKGAMAEGSRRRTGGREAARVTESD